MLIAVCDDNTVFWEIIKDKLLKFKFFENSEFVFFKTGKELIEAFDASSPFDFVFCDVDMPEMNGLEAGEKLKELSPKTVIVFVSSYPQYAVDAFDCNAVGYLLKGCDEARFTRTAERAIETYKRLNAQIALLTGKGIISVSPKRIVYIEYARKYCDYHMDDGEVYSVRGSLKDALSELTHFGFRQIYQCFVINMDKIQKIQRSSVLLTNGIELPIKRNLSQELIKEYMRFCQ